MEYGCCFKLRFEELLYVFSYFFEFLIFFMRKICFGFYGFFSLGFRVKIFGVYVLIQGWEVGLSQEILVDYKEVINL